ncbi:hypothetical protein KC19_10G182200 [Ceratodon purpureus]|uniref:Uncharacterized protein n=1 Tax=Ceratodon purpureus TaxID=3225 RepID=A0A8T0GQA1_CERPU|nr:hypothetical protein KC19_10G182200 [Ceratodon purpureus]
MILCETSILNISASRPPQITSLLPHWNQNRSKPTATTLSYNPQHGQVKHNERSPRYQLVTHRSCSTLVEQRIALNSIMILLQAHRMQSKLKTRQTSSRTSPQRWNESLQLLLLTRFSTHANI